MAQNIGNDIERAVREEAERIRNALPSRGFRAAIALTNSVKVVLAGQRSGKIYKVPGTYGKNPSNATKAYRQSYGHKLRGGQLYQASAPGEPPASRTNAFRGSFQECCMVENGGFSVLAQTRSPLMVKQYLLGDLLENGTSRMAARPYQDKTVEMALPKVIRIFDEPY